MGMPEALVMAASMMRMLAWWGTTTAMSAGGDARPWARAFCDESTMTRTARRKTSLPSICDGAAVSQ